MSIQDRRIEEWRNPISAEADRPNRSAADMKAIFDSNTNELKDALNGLIDDLGNGAMQVAFTEAGTRANISAADTLAVILGKLAKFFADAQTALNVVKIDGEHPNRFLCADGMYRVPSAGEAINGLPQGGNIGDILCKQSGIDYDASFVPATPELIGAAPAVVAQSVTLWNGPWTASGDKWQQTVNVEGVTEDSKIIVGPAPASSDKWAEASIKAVSQGDGTVTFEADMKQSDVDANIFILG